MAIPIGARQAPKRSALMDLSDAFRGFNDELGGALRDVAAQADKDAMALGELEATRTQAAKRLGEIEGTLKKAVDAGTVDPVHLPSFERGFRLRVGKDLASSLFAEQLNSQLASTTLVENRTDPEKVIADTYAEATKGIKQGDLYARMGFDDAAQGVIAAFRQRSAEGYTANYKASAEQKMADEGSEIALQLASAPADQHDAYRVAVKENLDALRQELPSNKVNEFYTTRIVAPAIDSLVSSQKFTEARNLVDEMERLDVTGKGGLLGQTSVGKSIFADLRNKIERESRVAEHEAFSAYRQREDTAKFKGELAAADTLQKIRLENGGQLPTEARYRVIDEFRKQNAGDALATRAFEQTIHSEYEGEDRWRTNERALSDIELSIRTLSKEKLAEGRARVETLYQLGEIPPSLRSKLAQQIDKQETLFGAYDEQDIRTFQRSLYNRTITSRTSDGQELLASAIAFGETGSAESESNALWDRLPPELQTEHQLRTTEKFQEALESEIRAIGDPLRLPTEKASAVDRAAVKAKAFARSFVRELSKRNTKAVVARDTAKATSATAQVRNFAKRFSVDLRFDEATAEDAIVPDAVPGDPVPKKTRTVLYRIPQDKADLPAYREDLKKPKAERDFSELRINGALRGQPVSLVRLAKDSETNSSPEGKAKARELYGVGKALIGYTPEEIQSGVTKHGLTFNAAEVDPRYVSVFRSLAELDKHWARGKPDDVFFAVGDKLDPDNKLNARQFYIYQRALLLR